MDRTDTLPASSWLCPSCSGTSGIPPRYPPSPSAICSGCGRLLGALERIAAAAAKIAEQCSDSTPEEPPAEELLNVPRTAQLLGISPGAVYGRVDRGTLRPVRAGRSLRFRRGDLLGSGAKAAPSPDRKNRR